MAGSSSSNDSDVLGWHVGYDYYGNPYSDYWIVKLDSIGNLLWQKCLGGSNADWGYSIQQTLDGGFIVSGTTNSNDGDVSGNHGGSDFWIVKLDTIGSIIWQRCLGGSGNEGARFVQQTSDKGFIISGSTDSNDGDVSGNNGGVLDWWIVKLDSMGSLTWQKCLGGTEGEASQEIHETFDGGFIVGGHSASNDSDVSGNNGSVDDWIVKLNATGDLIWQKCFGGTSVDDAYSIRQTSDSGFIVAGQSFSNNEDVSGHHGDSLTNDYWVLKLDMNGNLIWQKSLGGSYYDAAYSVVVLGNGESIVAGNTSSNDGDVIGHQGIYDDYWIIKLDSSGNIIWQKVLGGSSVDVPNNIIQSSDGGFVIAGFSSSIDGDVLGTHGAIDYWIVKLSPDIPTAISSPPTTFISLHPNPVQNLLTFTLATQAANATIRVHDLQGKIIALPTTFTNTQVQLNTTTLPNGFYTLQIINNKTGESEVGKFVKQE